MILTIIRGPSGPAGTFGFMLDENNVGILVTLELPWLNNQHNVSCIAPGTYTCKRIDSPDQRKETPDNGDRFVITGVTDREDAELHVGNTMKDSKGCVLLAMYFGKMYDGTPAILSSREGFQKFMTLLSGLDEFTLKIMEVAQ